MSTVCSHVFATPCIMLLVIVGCSLLTLVTPLVSTGAPWSTIVRWDTTECQGQSSEIGNLIPSQHSLPPRSHPSLQILLTILLSNLNKPHTGFMRVEEIPSPKIVVIKNRGEHGGNSSRVQNLILIELWWSRYDSWQLCIFPQHSIFHFAFKSNSLFSGNNEWTAVSFTSVLRVIIDLH